jgi:transcriptional regulator with XRE-family HTH domain
MLHQKQVDAVCSQAITLLQRSRESQGLSKIRVAERAGLSPQMVGYVEQGMRRPTFDTMVRMAYALEVDLATVVARAYAAHPITRK